MDQRHNNGAAGGANSNVNNNTCDEADSSKPNVPSKPQHLQGAKSVQMALPVSRDRVTPKGWSPPQKFTFVAPSNKLSVIDEKPRTHSESIFAQKWRPAPKVMQKQSSVKQRSRVEMPKGNDREKEKYISKYQHAGTEEVQNSRENESSTTHSKYPLMVEEGFGSLKRMWSQKSKSRDGSPQQSPVTPPRSKTNETRRKTVAVCSDEHISSQDLNKQSLSRSVSSSPNGSLRTASYKDRKVTWHYVTQSPSNEFANDALPSKIDLNETMLFEKTKGKKFDHKILAPRPFRATLVDEERPASLKLANVNSDTDSDMSPEKSHPQNKTRYERNTSLSEDSGSSSGEAEDSEEKEMRLARKRGCLVTRFDSRGNKYKVDPRTGKITYVEDNETDNGGRPNEEQQRSRSPAVLRRMNAISIEGATVSESNAENDGKRASESSNEEVPPPLLPRGRNGRRSKGSTVPPTGGPMRSSISSTSMYPIKKQNYSSRHSTNNSSQDGDLSPDSTVPPPLLARGQPVAEPPTQDYTPMSGSTSEMPIRDRGSRASSVSLNSFLDRAAYELMEVEGGSYEPMEPMTEEDNLCSYSAAVDPPKRTLSIREYHEIDPDPDVPIGAIKPSLVVPGSVPPPPDHEPPALPVGVKYRSGSQTAVTTPESPPPLPPMNQKKLNYIEVEIGKGAPTAASGIRQKSQKTNYSEVIIGARVPHAKDSDGKKGKSVKGKLMSMFSSKHDGYSSEGDVIDSTKDDDQGTTDFAKERNKLKRLSGRLLRKKKQKSREGGRQSIELESSSQGETPGSGAVGLYGSATNLSTTSSESSRSLSQLALSVSSGDVQAKLRYAAQSTYARNSGADRRRSDVPSCNLPPKLGQRSSSAVDLDALPMSLPKSLPEPENGPQETTPQHGHQTQRSGRDVQNSPVSYAPRVESQLHQHQHQQHATRRKVLPVASRPLSEPPVMVTISQVDGQVLRPASTQYDHDSSSKSPRLSKSRETVKVLPLTIIKDDSKNENQIDEELLSPNFPADAPPFPPGLARPSPPSETPPDLPPAPLRGLKPDRFKKRVTSGSVEAEYSAAEDIHQVNSDQEIDSFSDDVSPNLTVYPRLASLSASVRSKLLESEPLYQIYRSRTLTHASTRVRQDRQDLSQKRNVKTTSATHQKQNSEDRWQSDLMTDDAGSTTLWREVKEVLESGVGKDLTNVQMKLQQAQFEVVTSQASYMRSLNILIDHFMRDSEMEEVEILPKQQRKELFSNIVAVREIEQRFLQEIEQHFWDKLYLTDIAAITAKYAKSDFEVYVRYIQNQVYQDRVLTELQRTNDKFAAELTRLESSPSCNKLSLLSFLLLPMQRVTRLPLLISAVVNNADSANDKKAYDSAKQALVIVNKLVKKCNEGARKMQQTEQLAEIAKELVFAPKVKTYALVSQSRSVVKKGEMSVTMTLENRKTKVMKLWFFLFSDVLLLAKKRTFLEGGMSTKYEVIDWAKRSMLFVNERAVSENELFLVLLENCFGKRVELTLTPVSQNELSRWTDAFNPKHASESEDSIYESWDCPQYHCIVPYTAVQPDELTLDIGDVMRVLKKTGDGWLEGERLRDNEQGWFPADKCEEIEDEHVRARNLRNLYRIQPAGSTTHD